MFDLKGRIALVTGGGRGVGAAIAVRLAEQGAAVAVNDISPSRAEETVRRIAATGRPAMAAVADVTDQHDVARAVRHVEDTLGPVDILVNNAGIPQSGFAMRPFVETGPDDWDRYLSINLYGVLVCTHAVVGSMTERRWGRVVTITSDAGRVGERNAAAYSAAKAGAAGFSRALAKEVGRHGVTCNCVSLGWIGSPGTGLDPGAAEAALRAYPIARPGRPDDASGAVVWLASDEADWVTGQTVSVSGGYVTS